MRIEANCETCGRTFLLTQIGPESDTPGRCPFCGAGFGRHYTTILVGSVTEAEKAAQDFVQVIGRLQAMETGFRINLDGLLRTVTDQIQAHEPERAVGS